MDHGESWKIGAPVIQDWWLSRGARIQEASEFTIGAMRYSLSENNQSFWKWFLEVSAIMGSMWLVGRVYSSSANLLDFIFMVKYLAL